MNVQAPFNHERVLASFPGSSGGESTLRILQRGLGTRLERVPAHASGITL